MMLMHSNRIGFNLVSQSLKSNAIHEILGIELPFSACTLVIMKSKENIKL